MNVRQSIRERFTKLRAATHVAFADYEYNILYGYLLGLHESGQIEGSTFYRLTDLITTAWRRKVERLNKARRAA